MDNSGETSEGESYQWYATSLQEYSIVLYKDVELVSP